MVKKIHDLILAESVDPNMQLETDIGGVFSNKITIAQLANFVDADFEDRIVELENKVGDLETAVTDIENEISALESRIETNEGDISGINTSITNILSSISDLEGEIEDIENLIGNLNTDVGNLTTTVGNLSTQVSDFSVDIGDLQTAVGNLETDLGNLTTTVGNLSTDLGNLTTSLGDLTTTVGDNSTAIGDLQTDLGNLTTTVGNLATDVTNLQSSVSDLEGAIEEIEVDFQTQNVLYVAKNGNDTTGTGSLPKPYLTISKAVAEASSDSLIIIFPGDYTGFTVTGKSNITFYGHSTFDSQVKITGGITISSTTGIRMIGILVENGVAGNSDPALLLNGSGLCRFERCLFRKTNAADLNVIMVQGVSNGNHQFYNCFIRGNLLVNSSVGSSPVYVSGVSSGEFLSRVDSEFSVLYIDNSPVIGRVTHANGALVLSNIRKIEAFAGTSISSTANSGGINILAVQNVALRQDNLAYGTLVKSGTAPYIFSSFDFDQTTSLTGANAGFGMHAKQMAALFTPDNYTPADASLEEHLKAIDVALGAIDISDLETDVANLQTAVGNLSTDVGNLSTDVGNLSTDVGNLSTEVSDLDTTVSGFAGSISTLQTDVGTLNSTTSSLNSRVTQNESDIQLLIGEIGGGASPDAVPSAPYLTEYLAWGNSSNGALGLGDTTAQSSMVLNPNIHNFKMMASVDIGTTLALRYDGSLWGVGDRAYMGAHWSVNSVVAVLASADEWEMISAGASYGIGLKKDGSIFSWGINNNGRTAQGTATGTTEVKTRIGLANDWAEVSAANTAGFARKTNGTIWSWGQNSNGQTALNTITGDTLTATQIGTDSNWAQISGGNICGFAIKTDGTLWSWGSNANGRTGQGTDAGNTLVPTQIGTDSNWEKVFSGIGSAHAFAIKTDGTLWSWGQNANGRTGLNTNAGNTLSPIQVGTDTDWLAAAVGGSHSLGLKTDGTLWSWGSNGNGATGQNTDAGELLVPTQVGSATDWERISAGSLYSLATKSDNTLYSFGSNANGRTAQGATGGNTLVPTQVGVDEDWIFVFAAGTFAFAIKEDFSFYSWGANANAQTGRDFIPGQTLDWVRIGEEKDWKKISAGSDHFALLKTNGTIWSCGANGAGQCGVGNTVFVDILTQEVLENETWVDIEAKRNSTFAIRANSSLWGVGNNSNGLLGINSTTAVSTFTQENSLATDWAKAFPGGVQSLAIKKDGSLWGAGTRVNFGLSAGDQLTFVSVSSLKHVWANCGNNHTHIIRADGSLWACGNNTAGKLGNGNTTNQTSFVQIGSRLDHIKVGSYNENSVAMYANSSVAICGNSSNGKNADGTTSGNLTSFTFQYPINRALDFVMSYNQRGFVIQKVD